MAEYVFPVPGAARLASLAGIQSDLQQVVEYCDRMIERYAGEHLSQSPFDIVGFTLSHWSERVSGFDFTCH
jgi:hypothetical protein